MVTESWIEVSQGAWLYGRENHHWDGLLVDGPEVFLYVSTATYNLEKYTVLAAYGILESGASHRKNVQRLPYSLRICKNIDSSVRTSSRLAPKQEAIGVAKNDFPQVDPEQLS